MRRSKLFGANSAERKNHERKCLISFDNDCEFDPIANGPHSIEKMTRKYCTLLDAVRYKRVFTLTAVIVAYTHTHADDAFGRCRCCCWTLYTDFFIYCFVMPEPQFALRRWNKASRSENEEGRKTKSKQRVDCQRQTHTHTGARATPHSDALTSSCAYSLSYCLANGVSISRLPLYGLRVNAK